MNGPIGYVHKRRQRKLAMWTEGARQYLKLRMSQPTRNGKPPYLFVEPAIIDEFMDKLRHSSGFGNSARLAIHQSFTGELMELMRRKNRTAAIVRRAARIPQAVLAEILSNQSYQPSRELALLLVFALRLRLHEADKLLARAGYALTHESAQDVVLEYFLRLHVYHIGHINEVLWWLELPPLIYTPATVAADAAEC